MLKKGLDQYLLSLGTRILRLFGLSRVAQAGRLMLAAILLVAAAAGSTGAFMPQPVSASTTTKTVTTIADSGIGSLRAAISSAVAGDTITFNGSLAGHTIMLGSALPVLAASVAIDGDLDDNGSPDISIDGFSAFQIFSLCDNDSLNGLMMTHGQYPGSGGAITVTAISGPVIITNCVFYQNSSLEGGAIYNNIGSKANISGCVFYYNSATWGGAVFNSSVSSMALNNCLFYVNTGFLNGSAVTNDNIGNLTVTNCTFYNNSVTGSGALYTGTTGSSVVVKNSIFWGNNSDQISGDTASVTYSVIDGGYSGEGNSAADPWFVDAPNGDFHLQSQGGHWTAGDVWVQDLQTSTCVDAGDPSSSYSNEPAPNGGRINIGSYGNTAQASKTPVPHTVTFDSHGGSSVDPQTVNEGGKAVRPTDPTRTGFSFDDWYKQAEYTTTWNFTTDTVTAPITLHAKWNTNVTFDSHGGSSVDPQTVNEGGKAARPTDPTRTGFGFDDWYKQAEYTSTWNFTTDTVTAPITLHARWTTNVTFDSHGGSSVDPQTVNEGGKAVRPTDPTRTGFGFDDWYKQAEYTTTWNFTTDTVTAPITLHAKWTADQCTITFDSAGGSPVSSIQDDYGASLTPPANPTREGYTFTGWDPEFPDTMPRGGAALTAQWTINSYKLTVNILTSAALTAGCSVSGNNGNYDYGTAVSLTASPVEGWNFNGWSSNNIHISNPLSALLTFNMPAGNVTLTANFDKSITVTRITPKTAANAGTVDITSLVGTGFSEGASVKLTKSGQPDILGSEVDVVSASRITCSFDLHGAKAGEWDVVVTNPGGQSDTLAKGFTVTKNNTTTVLTSTPNPSDYGQKITFTAVVTIASGIPTGRVNFKEGSTKLGNGILSTASPYTAAFITSSLPAGDHPITAEYEGDECSYSSKSSTITQTVHGVSQDLAITTDSPLPNGQLNIAYQKQLAAAGGTPAYTWSLKSGSLPAGLRLNASTGLISGKPTKAGSFSFSLKVTDKAKPKATAIKSFTLKIDSILVITTASLTKGEVSVSYRQTLAATGNSPNKLTWSVITGSLPAGLTLTGNTISGVPEKEGAFNLTIQVSDGISSAHQSYSLTVYEQIDITSGLLPDGQIKKKYNQNILATGGCGDNTWALTRGNLPNGLKLNKNTGEISGTPSKKGVYTFTIRVTDSLKGIDTRSLTITIK
jgi:uncharacterized repeat protein (TIGR02543 family)